VPVPFAPGQPVRIHQRLLQAAQLRVELPALPCVQRGRAAVDPRAHLVVGLCALVHAREDVVERREVEDGHVRDALRRPDDARRIGGELEGARIEEPGERL